MDFFKNDCRGLNYVELILAMAIIGILFGISSVFMTLDYRHRANDVAALAIMQGLVSDARFCVGHGQELSKDYENVPEVGEPLCANTKAIWPEMVKGWEYESVESVPYESFEFKAKSTVDDDKKITCKHDGCVANWEINY